MLGIGGRSYLSSHLALVSSDLSDHGAHIGLTGHRAINLRLAMKPPHQFALRQALHVILDPVPGHDRSTKLRLVDGNEIDRMQGPRAAHGERADGAGALSH